MRSISSAREQLRVKRADHDVAVGDGQRPAAPVAGRAGIGSGGLRPDPEARAVERADRAAAGRDGVDIEHRRPQPHPGDLGLEAALEGAGIMGNVGGSAAHVEADHPLEAGHGGGAHRPDHAARRPRKHGVFALEGFGVGQAAVGLHEHQLDPRQLMLDPLDVAPEPRSQISVDHRGVAAPDQLHQRADLVADRNLGEPHRPGQRRHLPLVGRVAVAVQKDDGRRPEALGIGAFEADPGGGQVERRLDRAVGEQALWHLDHPAIEQLGQHDMAGEDVGAVLVADAQLVAEALGDHQRRRLAGALQEGVGGHRCAHLDPGDLVGGNRLPVVQFQQLADAGHRRVVVALGIVREQLAGHDPAIGAPPDHVGEGAAAVDPELPPSGRGVACGSGHIGLPKLRGGDTATLSRRGKGGENGKRLTRPR